MEWKNSDYGKCMTADPDQLWSVVCPDCDIYFFYIHYEHNCFPYKQEVF